MKDASQPVATSTGCPDFEVLSCFADGELDAPAGAGVAAHLGGCPRCAALTRRLREGPGGGDARPNDAVGGSGCLGEEQLVVYASGGLTGDDRAVIAAHVRGCDPCVASLLQIHRRLGVLAEAAAPIPAAVAGRARAVLPAAMAELAPARSTRRARATVSRVAPRLRARVRGWLQVPMLAPVALAAVAVLAVAVGLRPAPEPPGIERSRALPPVAVRLRVTADQTTVYSRPSGRSDVVGSVRRGTTVDVAGEEREWYQVRLDDGRAGWIAREAFE